MKKIKPDDLNVNPDRPNQMNSVPKAGEYSNIDDECQTEPAYGCTTQMAHGCNPTEKCGTSAAATQCVCQTYNCPQTLTCDPSASKEMCCAPDTKGDLCIVKTQVQCASIEVCMTSVEVMCETDNCHTVESICILTENNCQETDVCVPTRNDCEETNMCVQSLDVECNYTDLCLTGNL